jgi:tRNA (mo5U34)-methyltransferase
VTAIETPRTWYHTIDLPDGSSTPGYFDTRDAPQHIAWPAEVDGGRCLDVGTFDGFWAFELERRGAADVTAIDLVDPTEIDWAYDYRTWGPSSVRRWGSARGPGFQEAAEALGSKAKLVVRNVYDLDPDADGMFDVVLCGALLLHLRDPVRALEAMRSVCRGKLVLVEVIDPVLEVVARRVPAARVHPIRDEWWRVNTRGLRQLVDVAGFRIVHESKRFLTPFGPGVAPGHRISRLSGALTGDPRRQGLVTRAIVAEPRPPLDSDPANWPT